MSAPGRLVGQVYKWDPRRGFGFARAGAPPCSYFEAIAGLVQNTLGRLGREGPQ
jgi:hypothetical protein